MEEDLVLRSLVTQGYTLINDLNQTSDMSAKEKLLQKNGHKTQAKARELIFNLHSMIDAFDEHLEKTISDCMKEKSEVLGSLSEEIIQCVDYISNLCMMSENLLKEKNSKLFSSFGSQLKEEFVKSLNECRDLKFLDYDTFTSLDLEVDLQEMIKAPIVKLTNKNPRSLQRQVLYVLGFNSLTEAHKTSLTNGKSLEEHLAEARKSQNCPSEERSESEEDLSSHKKSHDQLPTITEETLAHENAVTDVADAVHGLDPNQSEDLSALLHDSENETWADPGSPVAPQISHTIRPCYMDQYDAKILREPSDKTTRQVICNNDKLVVRVDCLDFGSISDENQLHTVTTTTSEPSDDYVIQVAKKALNARDNHGLPEAWVRENVAYDGKESEECVSAYHQAQLHCEKLKEITPIPWMKSETAGRFEKCKELTEQEYTPEEKNLEDMDDNENTERESSNVHNSQFKSVTLSSDHAQSTSGEPWKKEPVTEIVPQSIITATYPVPQPMQMFFSLRSVLRTGREGATGSNVIYGQHIQTLTGGNNTSFDHPTGLTIREDGLVVIADTANNQVKILKDDRLLICIGEKDGVRMKRPSAVVCDDQNNIYVKDDYCIQAFDSNGKHFKTIGLKVFKSPFGLSLMKSGPKTYLVVVDHDRHAPQLYTYSLGEDRLTSHSYEPLIRFGAPNSKVRFIGAYRNMVLASDLGASTMFLSDIMGKTVRPFGHFGSCYGEFREPSGVTVDAEGNWLVADSKNNRIQAFTNDGMFLSALHLSQPLRRPSGIHLTSDGKLYVINYLDSVVKVYHLNK